MILAMDLSLSGAAFAVLEVKKDRVYITATVWVDNTGKNSKKSHGYRLDNIARNLKKLLIDYPVKHLVREKGFSKFAATTQTLFKVVGVSDLTAYHKGFENIKEIAPTSVKKAVTGNGKASKEEVDEGIRKYLMPEQQGIKFKTNDVSDAIAVGITYAIEEGLLKEKS